MDNGCKLNPSNEPLATDRHLYAELLMKNSADMLFLFDGQLQLIDCSDACRPLLCADTRDVIGAPLSGVFSPDVDVCWTDELYERNKNALLTSAPRYFDDAVCIPGVGELHLRVSVSPMLDDGGACHGTLMTVSDITELTETKRRAEDAARSKSSFLANMSHEIRTPMNAVKGLSELLALTELSSLQRNYIKNIISSANSLLGIINDILDFSKIDANKIDFIEAPYRLDSLITSVSNVVSMRADDKGLALLVDADPNLPTLLLGDDMRVKQVMTNLLSNAVKYTNEGVVTLRVRMEQCENQSLLCCSVIDSGIGIHEEDIPVLFDAFARVDLLSNRNIAGTGLGLAISKRLAVAMGGDITVSSKYGKGSVFTLRVPQKVVDGCRIAEVPQRGEKRVLLLGAGEHVESVGEMLGALGVSFTCAVSPEELDIERPAKYTHCISDGSFPDRIMRALSARLPECLFAVLKNIRHAMSISDYHDAIIYLPVFIAELSMYLNKNAREPGGPTPPDPCGEELTVRDTKTLVVDDNDINLIVSSEMLRSFGAEATCAHNGFEAVELCEKEKYDIIFMDHMMPGKDGIETTREIRSASKLNGETAIVALTANVVNDMKSVYLSNGMDDFIGKPIEMSDMKTVIKRWLPKEKLIVRGAAPNEATGIRDSELLSPEDIIAAFDNFGLYSSDVMREMNGDFDGYITRMEDAGKVLDGIVASLKAEVCEERWDDFSEDCLRLYEVLHGIGARDCSGRSRKLAVAGRERNINYINEDFYSLMGNMYMLSKKLVVIVPFSRGGDRGALPVGSTQYLHGALEKMGRALASADTAEAVTQLERAAAFSLDMNLDMALKAIKVFLEDGDLEGAAERHAEIFKVYSEHLATKQLRLDTDSNPCYFSLL